MEAPVNFDNLAAIVDHDAKLEAMFLDSFLTTAATCLDGLRTALTSGDAVLWRQQAHAFKGTCLNLGAGVLSHLCERAQADWQLGLDDKRAQLSAIEGEMARVCDAVGQRKKNLTV